MLIALEQLMGVAQRAAEAAAGRAVAAKIRRDRNAEAFARGEAKALQTLMATYGHAVEQGGLPDMGAQVARAAFERGAAIALLLERVAVWQADMARVGLAIEEEDRQARLKAAFADAWTKHGP